MCQADEATGMPRRGARARRDDRKPGKIFSLSRPSRPPRAQRRRKPLVLIADDGADARDLYAAWLESRGFRIVTARNGEEATAVAASFRLDLIVMDLAMPRLNGIEASRPAPTSSSPSRVCPRTSSVT
jgi:PleD family two-component response regulator